MKVFLSFVLSFALFFSPVGDYVAQASTPKYNSVPCTFSDIYPTPWYKTNAAIYGSIGVTAIAISALTYFTAGTGTAASAGPVTAFIGTQLGGLSGLSGIAATNAGLAMLGGGSVASGGLGVLGGVALMSGVSDLALGLALESIITIPSNKTDRALPITIAIPDAIGSKNLKKLTEKINELKTHNDAESQNILGMLLHDIIADKHRIVSSGEGKDFVYNHIISAICCYNMGDYEKAETIVRSIQWFVPNDGMSFLHYLSGLLAVTKGDFQSAQRLLQSATEKDENITPHLALAHIFMQQKHESEAISVLEFARSHIDDDNYIVNNTLASLYYGKKDYKKALDMYKEALSDITINEYEAECKTYIALCYYHLGDANKSLEWLEDAMDEIDDQSALQAHYKNVFLEGSKTQ